MTVAAAAATGRKSGLIKSIENSFTKVLLANHIRSCVAEDVREGSEEKLDELVKTLQKLMK